MKRVGGAAAVLIALVAIGAVAAAKRRPAMHPTLTASSGPFSVSGSAARPVFVLTGEGLRLPSPKPLGTPAGRQLCRLQIRGDAGRDYGDNFYVTIYNGPHGRRLYGAGRYHPGSNELDCIGIVVLSHSARRISFTFGDAYSEYRYPALIEGRWVKVVFHGEAWTMLVHTRAG